QAYGSIDYHLVRDLGEEAANELKAMRQMRNHIMKEFPYGIIFIEYGTEKITLINKPSREMFRLSETSIIGKRASEWLASYPNAEFSEFLRAYKEMKTRRHSFRTGLFDKYALHAKSGAYEVSSVFVHGSRGKERGDFITIKPLTITVHG
ncbi:MAG: hypothetical protein HY564_03265, partial [Candidatus Jacksonbacteria bacterium]|nr:hypothetical protein [Candidatus Jacksonbacteria bacterium]